ncbi:hypothetical protein SAMN02746066_01380 [Anaerosporobacter mobilis DSM 15930]|jgi:hypothetical protein|uniref:Uncharacterized protein n=1 Tax=Anaerosporobacter mobilis DSM 15930 TaxID=1120996 RepID=A0A1M7HHM4_9FIRM|nr:hypothetical protein [Anaerosporobacter mobilis]SHM28031.1 hypothetical protein SAMN02746066_01380 [Anaerosporobacter mobilis DSM 15930]
MNTLLEINIKEVDVKIDHEYVYINISHGIFTAKISVNNIKSLTAKLLKLSQAK